MNNEIEVFEYLDKRARIEGININDLQNLLLAPEKSYKNYNIKVLREDFTLIYDTNKSKNILLGCVKEYHELEEKDCFRIRGSLRAFNEEDERNCVNCHLKCIEKIKSGIL